MLGPFMTVLRGFCIRALRSYESFVMGYGQPGENNLAQGWQERREARLRDRRQQRFAGEAAQPGQPVRPATSEPERVRWWLS
jgi:hypothetical protein